jgi:Cys-rich protein (TIGR01571 family)
MAEGQGQYAPLYNQVPVGQQTAYAQPVAANPYAPQGQAFQQGYPTQPIAGQPQPQSYTTGPPMAYAQPVVAGSGVMVAGQSGHLPRTGQWSDGLCDCFNHCESLLVAWCVPPVRWAQTVSRAKLMGFGQALLAFGLPWLLVLIFFSISWNTNTSCEYDRYGYYVCTTTPTTWAFGVAGVCNFLTVILGCTYRGKIRQQYGIQGSACEDCLMHSFCYLCAITQESRHVDRDNGYLRI